MSFVELRASAPRMQVKRRSLLTDVAGGTMDGTDIEEAEYLLLHSQFSFLLLGMACRSVSTQA
jgi:hypothetical protein